MSARDDSDNLAEREVDLARWRAGASATSSRSICSGTSSPLSVSSKRRLETGQGRLRLIVVGLRRRCPVPDAGGYAAAACIALRDQEAGVRAPRGRLLAPVRLRLRRRALLQRLRSATASRHGVHADRQRARRPGSTFELFGDGTQSRSWTYVERLGRRNDRRAGRRHGTYNVGGELEASMNESIELLRADRREDARRAPPKRAVPGDQQRTKADTTRISGRARLGASRDARRRRCKAMVMGVG